MAKNKKHVDVTSSVEMTTTVVEELEEVVTPVVEDQEEVIPPVVEEHKPIIGTIVNCAKLNVRKEPKGDAVVIGQLVAGSEVMIDDSFKHEDFYKVCTALGVEGFCVKYFITIR